jgi:hypothetical protein
LWPHNDEGQGRSMLTSLALRQPSGQCASKCSLTVGVLAISD